MHSQTARFSFSRQVFDLPIKTRFSLLKLDYVLEKCAVSAMTRFEDINERGGPTASYRWPVEFVRYLVQVQD